jgi:hypothetical protein
MAKMETPKRLRLLYVTDAEGAWEYFLRVACGNSDILKIDAKNYTGDLAPDAHFVFGGDVTDKGSGDIRLCKTLISLKEKYPDRVFLLLGNRDVNKLVILYERNRFLTNPSIDNLQCKYPHPQKIQ